MDAEGENWEDVKVGYVLYCMCDSSRTQATTHLHLPLPQRLVRESEELERGRVCDHLHAFRALQFRHLHQVVLQACTGKRCMVTSKIQVIKSGNVMNQYYRNQQQHFYITQRKN